MLLASEALREFPGLYEQKIYAWVERGELHAVMIGKRWHYPEWELRSLCNRHDGPSPDSGGDPAKATKPGHFEFETPGTRAA